MSKQGYQDEQISNESAQNYNKILGKLYLYMFYLKKSKLLLVTYRKPLNFRCTYKNDEIYTIDKFLDNNTLCHKNMMFVFVN